MLPVKGFEGTLKTSQRSLSHDLNENEMACSQGQTPHRAPFLTKLK
jgi:hypothetical protein